MLICCAIFLNHFTQHSRKLILIRLKMEKLPVTTPYLTGFEKLLEPASIQLQKFPQKSLEKLKVVPGYRLCEM